ncbi:MAG: hypothetical protein HYV47_01915 [Candidatus Nealsonbacteria bacterium]|nr:hypothetical protein [Candidatus Nealsonbacteria bacterium]
MDTKTEAVEKVKSHLQKWVAVAEAANWGDNKQKIEELLQKRLKYLGLHPRKMIWCESREDMQKRIGEESPLNLHLNWQAISSYRNNLQEKFRNQYGNFSQEETFLLTNLLERIDIRKLDTMVASYALTNAFIRKTQASHNEYLLETEQYENFFNFVLDWSSIAYEDSLWHGLPEETKTEFKNYFAYLGEACEAGLTVWIPTRKKEYLFYDPRPFYNPFNVNDAKKNLPRLMINWPEIHGQTITSGKKMEPISIILEKLEYFKTRLDAENISQDIINKVAVIIGEINKLLPLLEKGYPNASLTFEARRIASNYLIELLESYLRLPDEFRQREQEALLEVLQLLHQELLDADKNIEGVTVREFKVMTEFLKKIYSPETLGV